MKMLIRDKIRLTDNQYINLWTKKWKRYLLYWKKYIRKKKSEKHVRDSYINLTSSINLISYQKLFFVFLFWHIFSDKKIPDKFDFSNKGHFSIFVSKKLPTFLNSKGSKRTHVWLNFFFHKIFMASKFNITLNTL